MYSPQRSSRFLKKFHQISERHSGNRRGLVCIRESLSTVLISERKPACLGSDQMWFWETENVQEYHRPRFSIDASRVSHSSRIGLRVLREISNEKRRRIHEY
jgi:hypothetical protein